MTASARPVSAEPVVTVIIPALNEQADIEGCIDAVGCQTYSVERVELVVVDGCSEDGTVERTRRAAARYPFADVVILENSRGRTSISLNVGLAKASGEYVVRIDARSRIQPDYLETVVAILRERPEIGVVGGSQAARARSERLIDLAVARALRNRWSTGFSRYRRATASQASDTVWMGAFRADDLRRLGGWAEEVALNEDYELNSRYRSSGRLVWFEAPLRSGYLPRRSVGALSRQYFSFGRVKGMWWARGARPAARQVALLAMPIATGAGLVVMGRRTRMRRVVFLPPLALLCIDALGNTGPSIPVRGRPITAGVIALYTMSWWTGVWVGWIGELLGAQHRHA